MIKKVIISVYEKRGLQDLIKTLYQFNIEILSSTGTAHEIKRWGYPVTEISEYIDLSEMPDGLVKTIHPKIYGGILLNPLNLLHKNYMEKNKIEKIDMVIVNFYPLLTEECEDDIILQDIAKSIDIGGPALVRAAAKASLLYNSLTVVTNANQYPLIIDELQKYNGEISEKIKRMLAIKALEKTHKYDERLFQYLHDLNKV